MPLSVLMRWDRARWAGPEERESSRPGFRCARGQNGESVGRQGTGLSPLRSSMTLSSIRR